MYRHLSSFQAFFLSCLLPSLLINFLPASCLQPSFFYSLLQVFVFSFINFFPCLRYYFFFFYWVFSHYSFFGCISFSFIDLSVYSLLNPHILLPFLRLSFLPFYLPFLLSSHCLIFSILIPTDVVFPLTLAGCVVWKVTSVAIQIPLDFTAWVQILSWLLICCRYTARARSVWLKPAVARVISGWLVSKMNHSRGFTHTLKHQHTSLEEFLGATHLSESKRISGSTLCSLAELDPSGG